MFEIQNVLYIFLNPTAQVFQKIDRGKIQTEFVCVLCVYFLIKYKYYTVGLTYNSCKQCKGTFGGVGVGFASIFCQVNLNIIVHWLMTVPMQIKAKSTSAK